jgi:hypothetical protein
MRIELVAGLLSLTAVAGLAARQQSSNAVPSARLTLVRELATDLVVAITNSRTVPLEHIGIQYKTDQGSAGAFWYRTGEPNPPIAPGTTGGLRLEDVDGGFDTSRPPEIVLLEFADGYYEGAPSELQRFFAERAVRVDDLRYWVGALANMPAGLSNIDATNYVRRAADTQKTQQPGKPSATASGLLALGDVRRPPGWIAQVLSSKGKDLEAELHRVTRHTERFAQVGTSAPVVAGRSARVEARTMPGIRIVPVLENLRDVPLQAWGLAFKESGRTTTGYGSDTCSARSDAPFGGAIGPRETRRLTEARRTTSQEVPGLTAELVFAVYRDGHAEGAADEIRRLLEQRKSRGVDCTRYH